MKKSIQPKLKLKTVICSNGDKFSFWGHDKVEDQINLTISKENHQAWTERSSSTKSSNKKVLKFQALESEWKKSSSLT
jgi:ribosomal protein L31